MEVETEVVSLSPTQVHDLIACRKCSKLLDAPVTTRCGFSYCRSCLLSSVGCNSCPEDECCEYSDADCRVDLTLQHVVSKLCNLLETKTPSPDSNLLSDAQKTFDDDIALKCPICLNRLLDPVTIQCGHSFCLNCVRWVMETTSIEEQVHCPTCRTGIDWPFELGVAKHHDPMESWGRNQHLTNLIWTCWSKWVQRKADEVTKQESLVPDGMDIAIFVCTASWPGQNTLLSIFEPRYRRMLRRTMASSHKTFGMIMKSPDGHTEESRFGTLLKVEKVVHGINSSIYIQTTGISRFRVKAGARKHDGYWVASIDLFQDETLSLDWNFRARSPSNDQFNTLLRYGSALESVDIIAAIKIYKDEPLLIQCLSNAEIMAIIRRYVDRRLDLHSAETQRVVFAQLRGPPTDDIDMLWWFLHVMALRGEFAAKMLASSSVRFRLENALWYIVCHIPDHYARIWDIE
jgi:hypothetical protein